MPEEQTAPPGSVVVGLDGSKESRSALHWAIRYASGMKRPVHAVAVWHQEQFAEERMIALEEFQTEATRWLQGALTDLAAEELRADLHTHLDEGEPSSVLLAQSQQADVLVLGNHRHGAFHDALLGSVAQRCLHNAACPVILVPNLPQEVAASG